MDFLAYADLTAATSDERVIRFFDDDSDGVLSTAEQALADGVMNAAENLAYSMMMGAWTKANIILLAQNDPYFKQQVAWVAMEMASERRPEFCQADGSGQFMAQYNRAIAHFKALKTNSGRSAGEGVAGRAATAKGTRSPSPPNGTDSQFTFAPSKKAPSGHGGF